MSLSESPIVGSSGSNEAERQDEENMQTEKKEQRSKVTRLTLLVDLTPVVTMETSARLLKP